MSYLLALLRAVLTSSVGDDVSRIKTLEASKMSYALRYLSFHELAAVMSCYLEQLCRLPSPETS